MHGAGSPELYAGLSSGERAMLVNWPTDPPSTDPDCDGVVTMDATGNRRTERRRVVIR